MDTNGNLRALLLKDLCSRLPYGVKIERTYVDYPTTLHEDDIVSWKIGEIKIKPYLRTMSSMTEEEAKDSNLCKHLNSCFYIGVIDWLNAHHFDYRNLIERGLAIAVTEENNPYETRK